MNPSWDERKITALARDILGCKCPDEVFDKIEISRLKNQDIPLTILRIDIGGILLVYVVSPTSNEQLLKSLSELVLAGRNDRDLRNFNRFRLVVTDNNFKPESDLTRKSFAEVVGEDDKLHIHFVKAVDIDSLT